MTLQFPSDLVARQNGWNIVSRIEENNDQIPAQRYSTQAEKNIPFIARVIQGIVLSVFLISTLSLLLRFNWVQHWKAKIISGKIQDTLYFEKILPFNPPQIISDKWGKIVVKVNNKQHTFKDAVLLPDEAKEWNWKWNATPMSHDPGVRKIDLDHYILSCNPKPEVVILSKGRGHGKGLDNPGEGVLKVAGELTKYLLDNGIKDVYIEKTAESLRLYKEISTTKRVAALIHTTC